MEWSPSPLQSRDPGSSSHTVGTYFALLGQLCCSFSLEGHTQVSVNITDIVSYWNLFASSLMKGLKIHSNHHLPDKRQQLVT